MNETRRIDILDHCLEKMKQGVPLDRVLTEYPEYREELKELLAIAKRIESVPLPQVSEEAGASCLLRVKRTLQTEKKVGWKWAFPKLELPRLFFASPVWARTLVLISILVFISWGTVRVSATSLPRDILYPVKLTNEKVMFILTIDQEGKAELRLTYSKERMQELVESLDEEREINRQVLIAMLNEAALALDNISRLSREERVVYSSRLEHLCGHQKEILEGLQTRVPPSQKETLERAIQVCHSRMEWMGKVRRNEVPPGKWGPSCFLD